MYLPARVTSVLTICLYGKQTMDKDKQDTPALLPCPFCGHEPHESNLIDSLHPTGLYVHEDADIEGYFSRDPDGATGEVWHMGCLENEGGCGAEVSGIGKEGAIAAWNRRAAAPQQKGEPVGVVKWNGDEMDTYYRTNLPDGTKLYTRSPSYDQGFAEAIEAAANECLSIADIPMNNKARVCAEQILKLKPPTDTITMSRDELLKTAEVITDYALTAFARDQAVSRVELEDLVSRILKDKQNG